MFPNCENNYLFLHFQITDVSSWRKGIYLCQYIYIFFALFAGHKVHLVMGRVNAGPRMATSLKPCPTEPTSHHIYSGWQGLTWHICCDTLLYHQSVARGDSCPSSDAFPCCRTTQRRSDEPCHCPHCCQVWGCHSQLHGGSELAQEDRPPHGEGESERCAVQGRAHRYAEAGAGWDFWASCLASVRIEL